MSFPSTCSAEQDSTPPTAKSCKRSATRATAGEVPSSSEDFSTHHRRSKTKGSPPESTRPSCACGSPWGLHYCRRRQPHRLLRHQQRPRLRSNGRAHELLQRPRATPPVRSRLRAQDGVRHGTSIVYKVSTRSVPSDHYGGRQHGPALPLKPAPPNEARKLNPPTPTPSTPNGWSG